MAGAYGYRPLPGTCVPTGYGRDYDMARRRGIMVRTFTAPDGIYEYAYGAFGADVYVICSEGVGWLVTEDRPLIVDTWQRTGKYQTQGEYAMPLSEILSRAKDGTDVDLADHIRTFGNRLDCNHAMWVRRLTSGE